MKNQTYNVLITGCNRGIGLEFAKQYAEEGWQVFATCRNPDKALALQEISERFPNVKILPLDVTHWESIQKCVALLKDVTIDLLINNAGIYGGTEQALGNVSVKDMELAFLTNAIGPLKISEALIPNIEKGQLKTIATISTIMSSIHENTEGGCYAYRASKAALNMIMKSLSIDLKPKRIKVLTLHPGWVQTDMGGKNAPIDVETSVTHLREVILSKHGEKNGHFYSYQSQEIEW